MNTSRREFIHTAAVSGAILGVGSALAAAQSEEHPAPGASPDAPSKKLKLLILGGTGFLGPHTVEAALARGHDMTLFNRGLTNTHLFPELEKLRGNRDPDKDGGLQALEGRTWDAVIDTSAYVPRIARASADALAASVKQYVFISTVSVYADHSTPGRDETAAVGTIEDETTENVDGETYGPLKALCEQAVEAALPGRTMVIRPGLIVGPGDPTGRFTYWPVRIDRGGEVLAPGDGTTPVQIIDVRDLAEWTIRSIEARHTGVFNAITPAGRLNMAEMLYGCKAATSSDARFTWVDADFLEEQGVQPWSHMPAWVPAVGEYAGFGMVNTDRAVEAGLTYRPLAVTARDTIDWFATVPGELKGRRAQGIDPDREIEVLKAWDERG